MYVGDKYLLPHEVVKKWHMSNVMEYQEYLKQYYEAKYPKQGKRGKGVRRHAFQWRKK